MYLAGLSLDPDNSDAHRELRELALRRTAAGGRRLGFFARWRIRRCARQDLDRLINALALLAYDPGNSEHMLSVLQWSHKLGHPNLEAWAAKLLRRSNRIQ